LLQRGASLAGRIGLREGALGRRLVRDGEPEGVVVEGIRELGPVTELPPDVGGLAVGLAHRPDVALPPADAAEGLEQAGAEVRVAAGPRRRSEERRVGKEWRSRWWAGRYEKKREWGDRATWTERWESDECRSGA